jgi:hypothetical protein
MQTSSQGRDCLLPGSCRNLLSCLSVYCIALIARCNISPVHVAVRSLVTGRNSPTWCLGFRNSSYTCLLTGRLPGVGIAARTLPAARFVAEHSLPMNSGSISVQSRERDGGGCMEARSPVSAHVQALVHSRETAGTTNINDADAVVRCIAGGN